MEKDLGLSAEPVVLLQFSKGDDGEPLAREVGSAHLTASVATLDGGSLRTVSAPDGSTAVRFPRFTPTVTYPRAVLRLEVEPGAVDPGVRDLEWGADVKMDEVSTGSPVDNGDNVIQRGLSSDPALFKAEVDGRRPACIIEGDQGKLTVRATTKIPAATWYRIRCTRHRDRLVLHVTPIVAGSGTRAATYAVKGPVGSVRFTNPKIPISIGGKLAHDGEVIAESTDQLNGAIALPVIAFH